MNSACRVLCVGALLASAAAVWSCASADRPAAQKRPDPIPMPGMGESRPHEYPGIHNAVAFHPGFVSGSAPEGDEGFDTLAAMGVRTIISVAGAEPEVEKAAARGMRYIHLPIGYNGFDEQRRLQLVRATRDAMREGAVYIHCHHGKHRSAGAAAVIASSLGWISTDQGVERMKVSGTAPNYAGLYSCAAGAAVLGASVIDAVPAEFPAVWQPSGFVKGMLEIDETFDRLREIEKTAWTTPADHPDLVPAAEAGRLADLLRHSASAEHAKHSAVGFTAMLTEARKSAQKLEDALAAERVDVKTATAQFEILAASCKDCHAKYRD